jgi:hypothetical protein
MRLTRTLLIAGALIGAAAPAWGFNDPGAMAPAPVQHVQETRYAENQPAPYAMNYADDAARTLGMKDGRWQAYSSSGGFSLGGGLDGGRPTLHLQWR